MIATGTAVILVHYRNVEDTVRCIRSIAASTAPARIIVVDNNPLDAELDAQLAAWPDVHLIRSKENLGFGRGNNLGIRWALKYTDAQYVLLLNNDATLASDAITLLENTLNRHPDIGIATPMIVRMDDPDVLWYGGGYFSVWFGNARTPGGGGSSRTSLALEERNVTFASGCAMLVRKEVFEKIGGFDPRFFLYEEDLDLCLRTQAAGWKIRYSPTAIVFHKSHGSLEENTERYYYNMFHPKNSHLGFFMYHVMKNKVLVIAKNTSGFRFLRIVLFASVYWFLKAVQFLLYGRWDAVSSMIKGLRDAFAVLKCPVINELEMP